MAQPSAVNEPTPELIEARQLHREMGLSDEEVALVRQFLGRAPNYVELGIYSVMWSEHCSYKNSKPVLRHFPTRGPRVLVGPGEGAGVVDIGDGLGVVFKLESHNHPSAVEPFQGAATGVGGIIRDIFSMGARPIALLNSLRFGELTDARVKYLVENVVAGIAGYGNCIGIPTVGGEAYFSEAYQGNPLVNVMCVGLVDTEQIQSGRAEGVGNPVIYVGPATGRDGIHGATFASEELGEDSSQKRPAVQVGDPFMEKLVMEATLEAIDKGLVLGVQDMGAAGLTCSSVEMAHKAGTGMELDLDAVPQREAGMSAYEMMLSESQERMLLVCRQGDEQELKAVFDKWGVTSRVIGRVTDTKRLILKHANQLLGDIPVDSLVDGCPVYENEQRAPAYYLENETTPPCPPLSDLQGALEALLQSPNIASKAWVYQQYDSMVRTSTAVGPGSDAAVVLLPGSRKALAMTVDCNARYVYLDPRVGGRVAVAEAARNLVCSGATPLAVTDNLNYGNPKKAEIFWQLDQSARGIAEACTALGTPVIGGNVSLYNETATRAIEPTPVIGMVGLIDDVDHITTQGFKQEGDQILLLGETKAELGGSEFYKVCHEVVAGRPPQLDLHVEKRLHDSTLNLIRQGLLESAHDLSEGGLAVALAESCIAGALGAEVRLESDLSADALLFSESQSRMLVTVNSDHLAELEAHLAEDQIPYAVIGQVMGKQLSIHVNGQTLIQREVEQLGALWKEAIPCLLESRS